MVRDLEYVLLPNQVDAIPRRLPLVPRKQPVRFTVRTVVRLTRWPHCHIAEQFHDRCPIHDLLGRVLDREVVDAAIKPGTWLGLTGPSSLTFGEDGVQEAARR